MNDQDQPTLTAPAIELAASLVASAAERDFHPTAAELKLQMLRGMPAFSEKELGFRKFLDFLNAAQDQGRLFVFLDDKGHPRLSNEPVAGHSVPASPIPPDEAPTRMRQDLWSAIVHWEDLSDRFWDRKERRAIYVPVDADGAPLWTSEPARFTRITPVSRDQHLVWMNEFAEGLEGVKRDALLQAIAVGAPRGAFKITLRRHGLITLWGAELQRRVTDHAEAWAVAEGVRLDQIVEKSTQSPPPAAPAPADSATAPQAPSPTLPRDESLTESDRLRRRLHGVIDRMNFAELAALQVPAIYLLSE